METTNTVTVRTDDRIRQISVVLAFLATVVVNALANLLPINNRNTGEISDSFPVYVIPAGYAFAIWGLIYLGLAAYALYQALPQQADNNALRSIGWVFVLSSLANIAWIFLWHYGQFALTLVAMLTILATLIIIYVRLGIGQTQVSAAMRWLIHVPFSIYLAWITVATILNVGVVLYDLGWDGWGISSEVWAAIMIGAALIIALTVAGLRRDFAYLGVIVWALAAVAVKHAGLPLVTTTAMIAAGIAAIVMLASIFMEARTGRLAAT